MLVLSRQRDESVMIGDDIEVTVVDVRGEKVRLGIRAPRTVSVHRKEIYDAIRRENQSAAHLKPADLPPEVRPSVPSSIKLARQVEETGLAAALAEARASLEEGGVPIGAALVEGESVLCRGRDQRVQRNDPAAEAAVECLRMCFRDSGHSRHEGAILYCTHPASAIGAGAALRLGVTKVVVGDASHARSASDWLIRQGVEVVDRRDPHCRKLVEDFRQSHEELWKKWQQ